MAYIYNTQEIKVYNNYEGETDVIYKVNYSITKTDNNGNAETLYKTADINISNLDNFIPYEDLTPEIVIGWIKEDLGTDGVIALENEVDAALINMLNTSIRIL